MPQGESTGAVISQSLIAFMVVGGAVLLACLDPSLRAGVADVLKLGVGVVMGYFFSQRATAAGGAATLNGMTHIASLIAAGTPGPPGPRGEQGPPQGENPR